MRGLWIFLLFISFSVSGFSQVTDTLIYSPKKKLTWADFQGRPKSADYDKGAQLTVSILLKVKKISFWSGRVTYDAYAVAYRNNSWVKPGYKDAYTLAHEQLHFAIAHIYAESLEIEINNLSKSVSRQEAANVLLEKAVKEMSAYQAVYDKQTQGGNNKAKQKEWANKIEADLKITNQQI